MFFFLYKWNLMDIFTDLSQIYVIREMWTPIYTKSKLEEQIIGMLCMICMFKEFDQKRLFDLRRTFSFTKRHDIWENSISLKRSPKQYLYPKIIFFQIGILINNLLIIPYFLNNLELNPIVYLNQNIKSRLR